MSNRAKDFFDAVQPQSTLSLDGDGRFDQAAHFWSEEEREAVTLALAAGRPLLVRGEAGSGKSQLARAVAKVLRGDLWVEVIHARFEALDLLYRLDHLRRLADAQPAGQGGQGVQDWSAYIDHGKYWQAVESSREQKQHGVLLIDKADMDVPNALLDVLANRSFEVPYTKQVIQADAEYLPFVVITTNEDRELPPAFVRRCVVLNQNPPDRGENEASFVEWLVRRGKAHDYCQVGEQQRHDAARQVWADRMVAIHEGYPPVGLAEYIDLLRALHTLAAGNETKQREWLGKLSAYALVKNKDQNQQRPPISP